MRNVRKEAATLEITCIANARKIRFCTGMLATSDLYRILAKITQQLHQLTWMGSLQ